MLLFDFDRFIKDCKTSKKEISQVVGVGQSAVSNIISQKRPLPLAWRPLLEKKFHVNLDEYEVKDMTKISKKADKKHEVTQVDSNTFMEVFVLSINAQAGYLTSIYENDNQYINELSTMLVPTEFEKGNYLVVEVNGDSMDDGTGRSLCHGDKLLCKQLQKHHWQSPLLIRKYLFVLVSNEGIVCKQITRQTETKLLCHSFNDLYEDYEIDINDLLQIFYVKKFVEKRIKF